MATLVLTLVGPDRTGLVEAVARAVAESGGNWERSQLAELAGVFAGVVQVAVPDARETELRAALSDLDGLLEITTRGAGDRPVEAHQNEATVTVLGNDRPGIVRDVSSTLHALGISVERLETVTLDAAMSGGRLFQATLVVRAPEQTDLVGARDALERLAAEIQVDIAVDPAGGQTASERSPFSADSTPSASATRA